MEEERSRVRQQAQELGISWVGLSLHELKVRIRMVMSKNKPPPLPPPPQPVAIVEKEPISPLPEPAPIELHGDELLARYKEVLQNMDDILKTEQRNNELIREFQNVWNDGDRKAFAMEELFTRAQKVTLSREALEIQEKWGDALRDREHAYTMMLENYSNGCGRVHEHIRRQISDLRSVLVRFEEDKKRFNTIVMDTMPPHQDQVEERYDEFNTLQ
jgi:hypothetical protein